MNQLKQQFTSDISRIKRESLLVSALRFLVILSPLFFILANSSSLKVDFLWWLLPLMLVFLPLLKWHRRLKDRLRFMETRLAILEEEQQRKDGRPEQTPVAPLPAEASHPFASDFDVLGPYSLFNRISRANTENGADELAYELLNPASQANDIHEVQQSLAELQEKFPFGLGFLAYTRLSGLKRQERQQLQLALKKDLKTITAPLFLLYLLPVLALGTLLLYTFHLIPGSIAAFFFVFNLMYVYRKIKAISRFHEELGRIHQRLDYLGAALALVSKEPFESPLLKKFHQSATESHKSLRHLSRLIARLDSRLNPMGAFLFNGLFLYDLQTIRAIQKWQTNESNHLLAGLNTVSKWEVICSKALYNYHSRGSVPELCSGEFYIRIQDLKHPLMSQEKAIPNDFEMDGKGRIQLITGSNMSGKSTYLRAIGTNLILAMNGLKVTASNMVFSPVRLISSMRLSDSLADDASYFYAELQKLKTIMEQVERDSCTLVVLDELLRGTNSRDKLAGSEGIVHRLVALKANALFATHDLALTELSDAYPESLTNLAFESQIEGDELYFDYRIRPGVCQNLNALFLLRKTGILP